MKNRFKKFLLSVMIVTCCLSAFGCSDKATTPGVEGEGKTTVEDLRVNSMVDPLGIDSTPLFSWILDSDTRGVSQKSYRITVAESEEKLNAGKYVWDTGEIKSSATSNIFYAGKALDPSTAYWWNVSVRDQSGEEISGKPAMFETGLMSDGFNGAEWISADSGIDPRVLDTDGMNWIWRSNGAAIDQVAAGTQYFRYEFTIDARKEVSSAYVLLSVDDYGAVFLNGEKVAEQFDQANAWQSGTVEEVSAFLKEGKNVIAAWATNKETYYAGFLARLAVVYADDTVEMYSTNGDWLVSPVEKSGWSDPDYVTDSDWSNPDQIVPYGTQVWGSNVSFRYEEAQPPVLRKRFALQGDIVRARVYATAAGVYDLYINGEKVGDALLAPGASEFIDRLYYQTYDVTEYVKSGANAMGAMLGNGWYRSGIMHGYTVADPAFLCKLVVTFADGSTKTVCTDATWQSTTNGPVRYNDFYNGEDYDARMEMEGWSEPSYNASDWKGVRRTTASALNVGEIVAAECGDVRVMDVLDAIKVTEPQDGVFIYDFGQNFAGVAQITVKGERGQQIRLRHGEILNDDTGTGDGPEGTLYTANLRTARNTDTYILRGDEKGETWAPTFTYHGFRYLEITGIDEALPLENVKGLVMYSDMEDTGSFTSSNELVNQLWSNTYWSQRSNFLSVPTDCPQRDERAAWLGDAQIFVGTAAFNMNVKQFFSHFIDAMNDGQKDNGAYTDVAPGALPSSSGRGGWGDAGLVVPYTMYQRYGDASVLSKYYDNMKKYLNYLVQDSGSDFIRDTQGDWYGDWVAIEKTPVPVTDTAYCVRACDIMVEVANVLGKTGDAAMYAEYAKNFRAAWNREYLNADGSTKVNTQTSYAIGICFDIIPENLRAAAGNYLVADIARSSDTKQAYTLTTGFLGTSLLLPALCETGHTDVAFKLLEQELFPSWLYTVKQGATTIWEKWNAYIAGEGFVEGGGMNSFNHYSYGSVMEWAYNTILGIRADDQNPGFTHFNLNPTFGGTFSYAKGSYRAQTGLIESGWELKGGNFVYTCTVPANTTATLYLPVKGANAAVFESNVIASKAEGVTFRGYENGRMVYELVSGTYSFSTAA